MQNISPIKPFVNVVKNTKAGLKPVKNAIKETVTKKEENLVSLLEELRAEILDNPNNPYVREYYRELLGRGF